MRAAAFGEYDNMSGVSSSIMLGQQAHIGTNAFRLQLDPASLLDAIDIAQWGQQGLHFGAGRGGALTNGLGGAGGGP